MAPIALITGGASGMGLAVATSLSAKGWKVYTLDCNEESGLKSASSISATFIKTDVANYFSLSCAFDQVFQENGQINFVFANAGVGERKNFYEKLPHNNGPPPELDFFILDIDVKSVINTAYLAQHYFRETPQGSQKCLILNSSIAGLYPVRFCPIYTAAKHGVVGFARSIAKHFFDEDGIRVNTLCPGNVKTNLFDENEWSVFDNVWIPLQQIVKVVEMVLFDEKMFGKVIEVAPTSQYFIEQLPYSNDNARSTLEATTVDHLGV